MAILFDGGYFSKLYKEACGKWPKSDDVIKLAKHISQGEDLFRIYYYDCPPCELVLINPLDGSTMDYSEAVNKATHARKMFQSTLAQADYIAFRSGVLKFQGWKVSDATQNLIQCGGFKGNIQAAHLNPDFKQKGVDMRIGLDIAHLSTKRIVEDIAIVTGDTDFIPAMKYARREVILLTLVDIKGHLATPLNKHFDPEMLKHADKTVSFDLSKI